MQGCLTFLGTSASMGVPIIGCRCSVCLSESAYNKRMRSAALLEVNGKKILIDVGPDFRTQALAHSLTELDGFIVTHTHYDHIGGFDDLRVFHYETKKPLPCLASKESFENLRKHSPYLLDKDPSPFHFQLLEKDQGKTKFLDLDIEYFSYKQTGMGVSGYRFGNMAFMTDIKEYTTSIFEVIRGCDVLILSALDWVPTRAHISVEEAIDIGKKSGAKQVFLTHIGHELDYEFTNQKLPQFVRLAYDGLSIPCNL